MSERWARLAPAAGLVALASALLWRGLRPGGLAWAIPLAVALAVAIVAGFQLAQRRRLARLAPGERWAGSVALDLPSWRGCPSLGTTAPVAGTGSALLLSQDLAPGVLVLEADGVAWRPGRWARWCGARSWRIPRQQLAGIEPGPAPGVPRAADRSWLVLWLADGTGVVARATSRRGLEPALEAVRLRLDADRRPFTPG